jgi:hypothetical protein
MGSTIGLLLPHPFPNFLSIDPHALVAGDPDSHLGPADRDNLKNDVIADQDSLM